MQCVLWELLLHQLAPIAPSCIRYNLHGDKQRVCKTQVCQNDVRHILVGKNVDAEFLGQSVVAGHHLVTAFAQKHNRWQTEKTTSMMFRDKSELGPHAVERVSPLGKVTSRWPVLVEAPLPLCRRPQLPPHPRMDPRTPVPVPGPAMANTRLSKPDQFGFLTDHRLREPASIRRTLFRRVPHIPLHFEARQ